MLTDAPAAWPFVSIVVPCRNEADYIGACLESILASDYPQDRLEVIVADGMSDDGTRGVLERYASAHPQIRIVDNPAQITPCAMNVAIRAANGELIARMDAHAKYPVDYLSRIVAAQQETGADNVGTVVVTLPADGTPTAAAIAIGLSQPLGVGNSHFRVGTRARRWVNHVPFGCWRRDLFDRIGLFDEEMVRDQDVEFNARILNAGGRILLLPDVTAHYHARRTLRLLGRMLYQYGYFKPLVARKAGKILTVRQLVPSLFVLGVTGCLILSPWHAGARLALAVVLAAYAALVGTVVFRSSRRLGAEGLLALVAAFPTIHVGYGVGYLVGVWDHLIRPRKRSRPVTAVALSR